MCDRARRPPPPEEGFDVRPARAPRGRGARPAAAKRPARPRNAAPAAPPLMRPSEITRPSRDKAPRKRAAQLHVSDTRRENLGAPPGIGLGGPPCGKIRGILSARETGWQAGGPRAAPPPT